ncbi:hypothetical protein LPB19_04830 [Marinobacter salinisoli]|uniref:DUF2059 domain-containing protein n=1 Tax=Marinobacter salinisoli TaxID=2769486 RepID=A0ABX7MXA3_9GAMM|nr:hypothetical protein [Marinobacter salinisoli]QSP95741.1 hypothetical protein LPB19_04830 [Marinobacter salinisoli]
MTCSHFLRTYLCRPTFALALVFTLASSLVRAEPLTDDTIQSFMQSLNDVKSIEAELDELTKGIDKEAEMPDFSRIFSASVENMEGEPAYDRLEEHVEEYGFDDLTEWSSIGDRIYQAWMAIEMEGQEPAEKEQMEQALAELEAATQLTPEQKAQMRAMMENAVNAMESAKQAPAEDIEAVRPHVPALRSQAEGN